MNWTEDYISPYTPFTFTSEQTNENRVSAKNLNLIGSQLTAGTYLISHHNHDDIYDSKEAMNTKYFSYVNKINSDADTIDGLHFSDITGSSIPQYGIIAWESSIIPTGFAICNGQIIDGVATPDMRDYFIPCAGGNYIINTTFGQDTVNYAGTVSAASHILTESELPYHCHTWSDFSFDGYSPSTLQRPAVNTYNDIRNTSSTGGGLGHTHSGTITLNQNVDNRMQYYALLYIIRYK